MLRLAGCAVLCPRSGNFHAAPVEDYFNSLAAAVLHEREWYDVLAALEINQHGEM